MTLESIAALVFVFGLLGVLRWWAGRSGRVGDSQGPLAVEQRLTLGTGYFLVVVREGDRRLVLACGPRGASLVSEIAPPRTMAAGEKP